MITSATAEEMSPRKQKEKPFESAFSEIPDDPRQRLDALSEVNRKFRKTLSEYLQPVVRTLLQEAPPADDPGRKELVHRVNYVLRDAGLAILDPDTGKPSTLVAEPYRIVLQGKKDQHNRRRNIKSLRPVELTEYIRQEPFLAWKDKVGRDDPETRHR